MGINYNIIKEAIFDNGNLIGEYNINEYKNNIGFFISYEYLLWKMIALNIKYKSEVGGFVPQPGNRFVSFVRACAQWLSSGNQPQTSNLPTALDMKR